MRYHCIFESDDDYEVKDFNLEPNENSLGTIAEWAFSFKTPFKLRITDDLDNELKVYVSKRGSFYDKKEIEHPSLHTQSISGNLYLQKSDLKEKYLCCVNPYSNSGAGNYKKYYIKPEINGLHCQYGELEKAREDCRSVNYDRKYYWWLYFEKLSKLYTDESSTLLASNKKKKALSSNSSFQNEDEELYNLLMRFAGSYVRNALVNDAVTLKQVKRARRLWNELQERKTVNGFNSKLMELMKLSPRRRDWKIGESVSQFLARRKEEFQKIIDAEEDLLLSMEAIAFNEDEKVEKDTKNPSFADFDIRVRNARETEINFVLKHLSQTIDKTRIKIYKIIPNKQNELFNKYKETHKSETKYFWHGSKSSNWASIIKNSLYCPINATNGRMFGNGIYLAPSSMKSLGYTDGGYWAGGSRNKQILGLYKTAYNPLCYSKGTMWNYSEDYKAKTLNSNHTCLHAKAGDFNLRNDEVIFYNNDAVCLEYLVIID